MLGREPPLVPPLGAAGDLLIFPLGARIPCSPLVPCSCRTDGLSATDLSRHLLTWGFPSFLRRQPVTEGSPAWLPIAARSCFAMATPDVSVHMEEVVVVTTPDGVVDGAGVEEVKTVLVTTNLSQHG